MPHIPQGTHTRTTSLGGRVFEIWVETDDKHSWGFYSEEDEIAYEAILKAISERRAAQ